MAESTEPSAQASEPREDAGVVASAAAEQNGEEQAAAADADADAADAGDMPAMNASLRALIVSADASIIIGKQGKHINEVREKSGARLAISQSVQGNPERIMTVSGPLDAVSKAFGLIVRRINDEPFDQPSLPGSKAFTVRLIVPNSRMGSVIGKSGSKIKEIQEVSGARLFAGEAMLPGSTERMLSISGVADAVHIAVYYVGTILQDHTDRSGSNFSYRPGAAPYTAAAAPGGYGAAFTGGAPVAAPFPTLPVASAGGRAAPLAGAAGGQVQPGSQTQQIYIPNDLVGSVIGKGGAKINEIRQASATHIKIMEPGTGGAAAAASSERLVTITGPPQNIQIAVNLLHQRVEDERRRLQNAETS